MLILTRKPGESLYIGDDVKITIVEIKGHQIRVGIEAPKELRIYREEIYLQILEENKEAASAAQAADTGLEGLPAFKGSKTGVSSSSKLAAPKIAPLTGSKSKGSGASVEESKERKKSKDD